MTRQEAERLTRQADTLRALGFTTAEADALRRISMTLQRWFERECGDSNQYGSWAIVRGHRQGRAFTHDDDGAPFLEHHHYAHGQGQDTVSYVRIPDRETNARTRLNDIVRRRNARITHPDSADAELNIHAASAARVFASQCKGDGLLMFYVQTDPRGAALYILRPGDVPDGGDPSAYYSRGICIY